MQKFNYQGVIYNCDPQNITNYIKISNNILGIYQKGVDNPYAQIDKESKTLFVNSEIESGTFGQAAEATRIKLCAVLNSAIDLFTAKGWQIESKPLGAIVCVKSCLDNRKTKDKIDIGAIFAAL